MKIIATALEGVLVIEPDIFTDLRGQFVETWNRRNYAAVGIDHDFVQDDIAASKQNVIRGIHGDARTTKLVSCLLGAVYLVVVDCRRDAPSFGSWLGWWIDDINRRQVLIPAGFGNGYAAACERNIFHYKQTAYYDRDAQFTYRYDDPRFGIKWPTSVPILSNRDKIGPFTQ